MENDYTRFLGFKDGSTNIYLEYNLIKFNQLLFAAAQNLVKKIIISTYGSKTEKNVMSYVYRRWKWFTN